jgi:hypothetical protein
MSDTADILTPSQIETYLRDGILVVPLLSSSELLEAQRGLVDTLWEEYGVDVRDLEGTGRGLMNGSSTNGSGELSFTKGDLMPSCFVYRK